MKKSQAVGSVATLSCSLILGAFAGGCTGTPALEHEGEQRSQVSDSIPGYQHLATASAFNVGDGKETLEEFGFAKVRGSEGVFGTFLNTGFSLALPNATAAARARPGFADAASQNAAVYAYFTQLGLPSAQVQGVTEHATVGGIAAPVGEDTGALPLRWYTTILSRAFQGIPISESFAWARLNDHGEHVSEAVYWPTISADAVADARALVALLDDPLNRAQFDAAVAADLDTGGMAPLAPPSVRIHHPPPSFPGQWFAIATVDVFAAAKGGGPGRGMRYFDGSGKRVTLPSQGPWGPAGVNTKEAR